MLLFKLRLTFRFFLFRRWAAAAAELVLVGVSTSSLMEIELLRLLGEAGELLACLLPPLLWRVSFFPRASCFSIFSIARRMASSLRSSRDCFGLSLAGVRVVGVVVELADTSSSLDSDDEGVAAGAVAAETGVTGCCCCCCCCWGCLAGVFFPPTTED